MQISLNQLTKTIEDQLDAAKDTFLELMAEKAVQLSETMPPIGNGVGPIDTGAYVTSFSITPTSGAGRSRSSHGKPRKQSPQEMGSEALQNMQGDITNLGYNWTKAYFSNRAPHAWAVEERYHIMDILRNVSGSLLEEAVSEVKAGL